MKKRFIGSCLLEEEMQLQYYVTQSIQKDGNKVYGIEVVKLCGQDREMEQAYYLTHSRDLVERIVLLLFHNKVTPMCMLHIIDERMTWYATTVQDCVQGRRRRIC